MKESRKSFTINCFDNISHSQQWMSRKVRNLQYWILLIPNKLINQLTIKNDSGMLQLTIDREYNMSLFLSYFIA